MGQDILSDLALLHIHGEIDRLTDEIVERFVKIKKKNFHFLQLLLRLLLF